MNPDLLYHTHYYENPEESFEKISNKQSALMTLQNPLVELLKIIGRNT
jgi:hypothetical protein